MASIAAPDKRQKKLPLLLLDERTSSDFPTGSSESSVVPELPMAFDMSANSNASTASEMTSTSSSASASSSSRGVKWWKRVTAMRAKRRRSGSKQESKEKTKWKQTGEPSESRSGAVRAQHPRVLRVVYELQ
ncbi:hypothetical protein GN244_ATG19372 [Phytophthora infestans]|uniref:Uncharacterized protein n=1 Tax=Phytophthora infestans TaxID=4787 RepID=A0A833VU88_PHYIN|nr:hypothetical protein GN244_ATG19372 [Phytophthora infestans]